MIFFKKIELTGSGSRSLRNLFLGKSSQNSPKAKPVLIFWSSTMFILFVYNRAYIVIVKSCELHLYYDLSVHVGDGFPKRSGWWVG